MKNRTLRISLILAILTLVTSCFMGSTFAKYTTSDDAIDTARVAKWGVTVVMEIPNTTANDLATFYTPDSTTAGVTKAVEVNSGTDKLVAPGTKGTIFASKVTGIPEVAVNVNAEFVATFTGWEVGGAWYCPLKFHVTRTQIGGVAEIDTFYGMDYADADAFKAAIEAWFNANNNYEPNKNLACEYSIDWEWLFEGTDGKQTDVKDTALGDLAIAPLFTFDYTITVTQID